MATPGKLRNVVAEAFGLSEQLQMVDVHLRNLREGGLIAKAKTGKGAAEVGPADAAHLIMALAGSTYVKDSVSAVQKFSGLPADPLSFATYGKRSLRENFHGEPIDLTAIKTFGKVIERILVHLSEGDFFPRLARNFVRLEPEFISLRFYVPLMAASVHLGFENEYSMHQVYGKLPARNTKLAWDLSNLRCEGRLISVRVVDAVALSKIAAILKPA